MSTTVIHVRDADFSDPNTVYIGRANWSRRLAKSKWFNPFRIGKYGTREDVIEHYRQAIQSRPDLLEALPELRGKTLVCWCAPEACHGDVLAELANEADS